MIAWPSGAEIDAWLVVLTIAAGGLVFLKRAEMNIHDRDPGDWPWYLDPLLLVAGLIIAVA